MAVTPPAALVITPASSLILPPVDADPLDDALLNTNWLYLQHKPALVSVCPITVSGRGTNVFWIPIVPSADALQYAFLHRFLPGAAWPGGGTVTIQVEWAATLAGAWTSIYGPTATAAMVASTWVGTLHVATIPAAARILRVTYSVWAADGRVSHILAWPSADSAAVPFVAPWGQTASGFRVYDDALLYAGGAAGQPVNTEMLDRCRRNSAKVLRDRWQMAFSLVQDDTTSAVKYIAPSAALDGDMEIGHSRFIVPALKGKSGTLVVYAIATVSGGATADLVKVTIGNVIAKLTADGVCNHATMAIAGDVNEVSVRVAHVGVNTTSLHSVVGLWLPDDTELTICGDSATPAAPQSLLYAAVKAPIGAAFQGYAACGHMVDGNVAGQTATQIAIAVPPGVRYAQAHITRCGSHAATLALQSDSLVGGTTAGLPATMGAPAPLHGAEAYMGTGAELSSVAVVSTGTAAIASPDPARAILLIEQAIPWVELIEVNTAAGFCVQVIARTSDLETL